MATLADLFASTQAPNPNQLMAKPVAYQRGGSRLSKAVGTVGDILAAIGGRNPVYEGTMQARENAYNQSMKEQQFQNVFRNFVENPNDPAVQANLAYENPDAFLKVAPQNKILPQGGVVRMGPLGTPEMVIEAPVKPVAPTPPILRNVRGVGLVDATDPANARVVMPERAAPPARAAASSGGGGGAKPAPGAAPAFNGGKPLPGNTAFAQRYNAILSADGPEAAAEFARSGRVGNADLPATQFGQVKARIAKIPTLRNQIGKVENALDGLESSLATGPIGGRIPAGMVDSADVFDSAVASLRTTIQGLTRIAGEGSISDYEQRLKEATLPSRTSTPAGRKAAVQNLKDLAADLEAEYQMMTTRGVPAKRPPLDSFVR